MPKTFTNFDDFETIIYNNLVLVEFVVDWKEYSDISKLIPPQLLYYRCNVDEQEDIAEWCDINDIPTFICYDKGDILFSMDGDNKHHLKKFIDTIKFPAISPSPSPPPVQKQQEEDVKSDSDSDYESDEDSDGE